MRNTPTDRGRELGALIGKLTDKAEAEVRIQFPNHARRCKSCAFTAGTFPNGCEETILDALKCVAENEPFFCHQNVSADGTPEDLCAGWLIASTQIDESLRESIKGSTVDWEYTKPDAARGG